MNIDNAIKTLKNEQDPVQRRNAAQEIMSFGTYKKDILEVFIEGLMDNDLGVKDICSRALINTTGDMSVYAADITAPLVKTDDIELRNLAGDILLGIGTPSIKALKKLIHDKDNNVRQYVCELLGRIGNETVLDELYNLLTDENPNVLNSTIEALGNIGSEKSMEKLIPLYDSDELKPMVIESISKIGGRKAQDFLIEKLDEEEDEFLKTACIDALAYGAEDSKICVKLIKDLPHAPDNLQPIFLKTIFAIAQRKNISIELPAELRPIARKALIDNDEDIRNAGLIALGPKYYEADIPGLVNESLFNDPDKQQLILFNLMVNSESETVIKFFNNLFSFSDPDSIYIEFISFLPFIWSQAKEENTKALIMTIINTILDSKRPNSNEAIEIILNLDRETVIEFLSGYLKEENRYLDELLEIVINFELSELREHLVEAVKRNEVLSVKVKNAFGTINN